MRSKLAPVITLLMLSACGNDNAVNFTHTSGQVQTATRSEPIFYNGKTYRLDFSYLEGNNSFDLKVAGMSGSQQYDAVAVSTSGLRYFACPDGQSGQLIGQPHFEAGIWNLKARCA
jgi:hypothetical protein